MDGLNISCGVAYRASTASAGNGESENWQVRELTEARTFTFGDLTLIGRVLPSSTFDDVVLRFEVPQSGATHEFHLPSSPGIRPHQTGTFYAEHPTTLAELQFGCARTLVPLHDAPIPSTSGAACTVTESKDGVIERTERIAVTVSAPTKIDLRGGTFNATLMSNEEEGLLAGVRWAGPPARPVGISQIIPASPVGDKPFTANQLGTSITGLASVRTPIGTDISYVCEAQ